MNDTPDPERNRLSARIGRVAQVSANMSGAVGARVMGADQAALARARKQHKPAKDIAKDIKAIPGPGQQPTRPPMCQPSTAFGIAPSALVPAAGAS